MIRIALLQILLPIATYFIGIILGVIIGIKFAKHSCEECNEIFIDVSPDEIQHVGYTPEQCGYDK